MIYISYTGLGEVFFYLVLVVLFILSIIASVLHIEMPTYAVHLLMVGLLISGLLCWFLGKLVNQKLVVGYDENNEPIILENLHKLYRIPVQYFGLILIGLSMLLLVLILFV